MWGSAWTTSGSSAARALSFTGRANTWTAATAPGPVAQELKTSPVAAPATSGPSASPAPSCTTTEQAGPRSLPNDRHPLWPWIDNDGRVWVVGDRGITALINGTQVQLTTSPVSTRLRTILFHRWRRHLGRWRFRALLRYTGSGWNQVESGTRQNLYSISGSSSSSLWAVGGGGTFPSLRRPVLDPRNRRPHRPTALRLAGYSNTQSRTIGLPSPSANRAPSLRYTGADWVTDPTSPTSPLHPPRCRLPSPSEIGIVGDAGTMV